MKPSSIAIVVAAAGVTGAALIRNDHVRGALRREAELIGLRAYLAAVDRGASHRSFVADVRRSDCVSDGAWLVRAYGAGAERDQETKLSATTA